MNNTMTNNFASIIADRRYIADKKNAKVIQLVKDDFASEEQWNEYTRVVDILAISAWNSLNHKTDDTLMGAALAGLFDLFGCDAKATMSMQKRFTVACVQVRKEQSIAMKKAKKVLNNATEMLKEEQAKEVKDENAIKVFEGKVAEAQAEVERLANEPNNVWLKKTPMLTRDYNHATDACRKNIEDTMADIIAERELMTIEELQEEALQLKAARKARQQMKAQAKASK